MFDVYDLDAAADLVEKNATLFDDFPELRIALAEKISAAQEVRAKQKLAEASLETLLPKTPVYFLQG